MATKKKSKKVHHRRRHHVGGVKPNSIEYFALMGLGAVAGGVASAYIVQALQTALGPQTPLSVGPGIVVAGGLGVAVMGKGNPIALGAGAGMAAVGGAMLLNETFLNVPGISGMPGAFSSNASPASTVLRNAVGTTRGATARIGAGRNGYVNKTVAGVSHRMQRLGVLASN